MDFLQSFVQNVRNSLDVEGLLPNQHSAKNIYSLENILHNKKGGFTKITTKPISIDLYLIRTNYKEVVKKTATVLKEEFDIHLNNAYLRKHPSVHDIVMSTPEIYIYMHPFTPTTVCMVGHCLLLISLDTPYQGDFFYGEGKGYGGFTPVSDDLESIKPESEPEL